MVRKVVVVAGMILIWVSFSSGCARKNSDQTSLIGTKYYKDVNFVFRGFKFGSRPAPNMLSSPIFKRSYKGIIHLEKKDEILKIGDIDLDFIIYSYYQNKLYSIIMTASDHSICINAKNITEALEAKYSIKFDEQNIVRHQMYMSNFENTDLKLSVSCNDSRADKHKTYVWFEDKLLKALADQVISEQGELNRLRRLESIEGDL